MKATVMITLPAGRNRFCLEKAIGQTDLGLTPRFSHLLAGHMDTKDQLIRTVYLVEPDQLEVFTSWLDSVPEVCKRWSLLS